MRQKKKDQADIRTEFPKTPAEYHSDLNYCTDSLRRLVHETVVRTRTSRLFQAIRSFQRRSPAVYGCYICQFKSPDPNAIFILGECGHTVCMDCRKDCEKEEKCMFKGCGGSVQRFRVIRASDLGREVGNGGQDMWKCYGGSKLAELIKLLQDPGRIGINDQVILFIQFPGLMETASAALTAAKIPHLAVPVNDRMASTKLAEFQTGSEEVKSRVLILNLGSVTASGL